MSQKSLPPIHPDDLRDQANPERVERIWDRLAPEIASRVASGGPVEGRANASRPARHVWLIAAALGGTFGAGIWLGHTTVEKRVEQAFTAHTTNEVTESVYAAGSESRAFSLPNGGKLLLQPESTVEVAGVTETGMTLRLLRGSASIDATHSVGGPIAIVTGEARLTAAAGGSVRVQRNERDVDVVVSGGSVEVDSPAGHRVLMSGQSTHEPIFTTTATRDDATPPRRASLAPPFRKPHLPLVVAHGGEPEPEAKIDTPIDPLPPPSTAATWHGKYTSNDWAGAVKELEKSGGIASAIETAHSGAELAQLADLAKWDKQEAQSIRAMRRLVDEFPNDPNAPSLAYVLSNVYRGHNDELASKYLAAATPSKALAENVACAKLQSGDRTSIEIVEAAKSYQASYPAGLCKDLADQIVGDAATIQEKDPKKDDSSKKDDEASKQGDAAKKDDSSKKDESAKKDPPARPGDGPKKDEPSKKEDAARAPAAPSSPHPSQPVPTQPGPKPGDEPSN